MVQLKEGVTSLNEQITRVEGQLRELLHDSPNET